MENKKLKKVFSGIAIGLLVLIIAGALVFSLFGDKLIRVAVETGAKAALQVDVRLEKVSTSLLRGKVELNNFEIDNPEGYEHETFMEMGHVLVDLNTSSLIGGDTIEIDVIQLEDLRLVIEQKGLGSNINEILDNLPESKPADSESESKPAEEGKGKNLLIKVLEINNIEVQAKLLPTPGRADTVKITVPPIRMEDIGSDEKVDIAVLTGKIIRKISEGIAKAGTDQLPTDMVGSLGEDLSKQGKKLLEGGKGVGEEATEALKGIGDLFKKDK